MSFGKLLVLLLGLAIVAFAVKTELAGTATGRPGEPASAKRQLDSVRNRADELGKEQQKAADDVAEKAAEH
jgi:hypothetical protein